MSTTARNYDVRRIRIRAECWPTKLTHVEPVASHTVTWHSSTQRCDARFVIPKVFELSWRWRRLNNVGVHNSAANFASAPTIQENCYRLPDPQHWPGHVLWPGAWALTQHLSSVLYVTDGTTAVAAWTGRCIYTAIHARRTCIARAWAERNWYLFRPIIIIEGVASIIIWCRVLLQLAGRY